MRVGKENSGNQEARKVEKGEKRRRTQRRRRVLDVNYRAALFPSEVSCSLCVLGTQWRKKKRMVFDRER